MQPHSTVKWQTEVFSCRKCVWLSSQILWNLQHHNGGITASKYHCTHTHGTATHKALLPSHLSVLQVTGVGYAQSPPPCVMVRPSPWTRAWSPFRTMDSSFHRAMFSWPSPTNSATAWDLRSVVTLWCDYACSSIVASNINLAASWIHEVMMYNLSEK